MNAERMQNDGREGNFHTTHWSLVLAAACRNQAPESRTALAELCQVYWYPLYAHVRRRGYDPDDAKDLTQSFFLHLIEHEALAQVDSRKGKFRSFLLASLITFSRSHTGAVMRSSEGGEWIFFLFCGLMASIATVPAFATLFELLNTESLTHFVQRVLH